MKIDGTTLFDIWMEGDMIRLQIVGRAPRIGQPDSRELWLLQMDLARHPFSREIYERLKADQSPYGAFVASFNVRGWVHPTTFLRVKRYVIRRDRYPRESVDDSIAAVLEEVAADASSPANGGTTPTEPSPEPTANSPSRLAARALIQQALSGESEEADPD
jgi:hypothetical protein